MQHDMECNVNFNMFEYSEILKHNFRAHIKAMRCHVFHTVFEGQQFTMTEEQLKWFQFFWTELSEVRGLRKYEKTWKSSNGNKCHILYILQCGFLHILCKCTLICWRMMNLWNTVFKLPWKPWGLKAFLHFSTSNSSWLQNRGSGFSSLKRTKN